MVGEALLVFLSDADITLATQVAEQLREALASHKVSYHGHEISVTVSLGGAQCDGISVLDQLLYQAKEKGRKYIKVIQPQLL